MNKKIFIVIILIIIIISGIFFIKSKNEIKNNEVNDNNRTNISEEFLKEKEYFGMQIKNIEYEEKDGITHFSAIVVNNSGQDYNGGNIKIVLMNSEGKDYDKINTVLLPIKSGKTGKIDANITKNLMDAKNFRIETNN